MDVDIEIDFAVNEHEIKLLETIPSQKYSYKVERCDKGTLIAKVSYKTEDYVKFDATVGEVIKSFLVGLEAIRNVIKNGAGRIRLGIFYHLNETMVFPFFLSAESIRVISDFNILLDATGYPCND
jgi:hypothetical protein